MSAEATLWAWRQDVRSTEKLILLAYADQARDDGAVQLPQGELTLRTGLSERAVRDNLGRLEADGGLRRYAFSEAGKRIADITVLAVDGSVELPADFAGGRLPSGFAGSKSGSGTGKTGAEPPALPAGGGICRALHQPTTDKDSEEGRRGRRELPLVGADVPESMVADATALLARKTKVGGQIVTPGEMAIAVGALAVFNREAGYDYGLAAHATKIVGRIRERPAYDVATHGRLVASAWRLRWWEKRGSKRRPTPAVVYGNAGVFEQVIQDATDEKAGRDPSAEDTTAERYVRKGPIRPW